MDVEAVRAALSPQALAAAVAGSLGLDEGPVTEALVLLAQGAQPAFIARYRSDRVPGLSLGDLERIQGAGARAAAFEFQRQGVRETLANRPALLDLLEPCVAAAKHPLDLEDIRGLLRGFKGGPGAKAGEAGLGGLAMGLLMAGTDGLLADLEAKLPKGRRRNRKASAAKRAQQAQEAAPEAVESADQAQDEAPDDIDEISESRDGASEDEVEAEAAAQVHPTTRAAAPAVPVEDPEAAAAQLLTPEFPTVADALAGTRTICAERIAQWPPLRQLLRQIGLSRGHIRVTLSDAKPDKLSRVQRFAQRQDTCASVPHTVLLGLHRGERERLLSVDIELSDEDVLEAARAALGIRPGAAGEQVEQAVLEAWAHGLGKAVRAGIRRLLKERADSQAIAEYAEGLRPVLLAPAMGHVPTLGIDPGFAPGCRLVVVDGLGHVVEQESIFPLQPKLQVPQARARLWELLRAHGVRAVAIADSAGGRDLERLVREVIHDRGRPPVHESSEVEASGSEHTEVAGQAESGDQTEVAEQAERGESIEVAPALEQAAATDDGISDSPEDDIVVALVDSEMVALLAAGRGAKDELGEDAQQRRATLVARRLQDPLRELVKVDPRKLPVGQFQHEVDQEELRGALEQAIASAVSEVGVDLHRADPELLAKVAGMSHALARALIHYQEEHGPVRTRAALFDVPGIVGRTFEQVAGFVRIVGGEQPLDATRVHPERYPVVTQMARNAGVTVAELIGQGELLAGMDPASYLGTPGVSGEPLGPLGFAQIVEALRNPSYDPRPPFEAPAFDPKLRSFSDLQVGQDVTGVVSRVANFGAFVDVGLSHEGLIHISELAHGYVARPSDVVHVGQVVHGRVVEIDGDRKRFSVSLRALMPRPARPEGEGASRGRGPRRGASDAQDKPRERRRGGQDRDGREGDERRAGRGGGHKGGKGRARGSAPARSDKGERTLNFNLDLSALMDRVGKG